MLTLDDLDSAVTASMAHGAMSGADPLTDSLYGQLEAPAAEGALAAGSVGSGLTPEQRAALTVADDAGAPLWLLAMAMVLSIAASVVWPWGAI